MKECKVCQKTLTGKQTVFCSSICKSKSHNKDDYSDSKRQHTLNRNKIWRDKHKKEVSENKRKYYQNHKEKLKAIRREYHRLHPEKDRAWKLSIKGKLMMYKRGAETRGLVFDFTLEDFKEHWDKECHYCGDKVSGIGLDRLDNKIGYTKENTVDCCFMCNRMKHAFTLEEFINQCKKIYVRYK